MIIKGKPKEKRDSKNKKQRRIYLMKKKLLSLLVAATMIGSMAGTTTVFAGEGLEDVSEPVTLSLMVTTRPSTDNKDFYPFCF